MCKIDMTGQSCIDKRSFLQNSGAIYALMSFISSPANMNLLICGPVDLDSDPTDFGGRRHGYPVMSAQLI